MHTNKMADSSTRDVLQQLSIDPAPFEQEKLDLAAILACSDEELIRLSVLTMGERIKLRELSKEHLLQQGRVEQPPPPPAMPVSSATASARGTVSALRIRNERQHLFQPYRSNGNNGYRQSRPKKRRRNNLHFILFV